ncbi:helix-turn-helix transcriptional regulator [Streptomyces shenzhenensis]|uniref:Transcriptional regulator n=1 Tax=Streptomyces shenzhenensis TaxID=943815 RepID=A0A3M0HW98_9ACTN|nr:helix-turn-helix transcriptional regulator [Streptomyces shenzhenensis]RMB80378.1 transcriptional regulator [Streptomyces shenzhenensis]
MDKQELGDFLRSRRERLRPSDVGLAYGARRRTPGLRREEVAVLAHISTEYYTRLEQGRAPRPSSEVLAGITDALLLTDAEATHLHDLAGTARKSAATHDRTVRASIVSLIDRLPGAVGVVLSAAFEIIAWNDLGVALLGDLAGATPADRNLARRAFLPEVARKTRSDVADMTEFRPHVVSQLRTAAARYADDPVIRDLVAELRANSEDFDRLWQRHDVQPKPIITKTFRHPEVGPITVDCDTLLLPDRDQQLVLFTARPGSSDAETLELLRIITSGSLAPG